MARFLNKFGQGAPTIATAPTEQEIMSLLEPAAQRAAIDLYVLSHGRPGQAMQRKDFYEVTFVQFLLQYLLMSPTFAGDQVLWEVPYKPASAQGHPFQVDLEIRRTGNAAWQRMMIEAGLFTTKKLKEDSEKLRGLSHQGAAVQGEKRVILYWLGSDAPKTPQAVRELVRKRQRHKQNVARMGPLKVKPLWVRGFELYTPASTTGSQFSAVMFDVL